MVNSSSLLIPQAAQLVREPRKQTIHFVTRLRSAKFLQPLDPPLGRDRDIDTKPSSDVETKAAIGTACQSIPKFTARFIIGMLNRFRNLKARFSRGGHKAGKTVKYPSPKVNHRQNLKIFRIDTGCNG